jgi:sugar phosphate isomerase/epimerase
MTYVYFTKLLKDLDVKGLITFAKETGLDGFDLTVRPGYPVTPDNAMTALPEAAKTFRDAGLTIGLATAPTNLIDAQSKQAQVIFDACAKAGVPAVKIGYFTYRSPYNECLKEARERIFGFAKLAERTKVKACYHTHSGNMLGNNAASLRMLLADVDPHHVGAFFDTGHTAVNGGPVRMELDLIRSWLSLVAIKDMLWTKGRGGWNYEVVPAGTGIVRWADVGKGLKECKFTGTISLHGEYEAKDMEERKRMAKEELAVLKKWFGATGKGA